MHDSNIFVKLVDHLFDAQMARYRSKCAIVTFPADATYTPPTLPAHISVDLRPVSGSPSDDEIIKVQYAAQAYQGLKMYPSMFDPRINRVNSAFVRHSNGHTRHAGETQSSPIPQATERPEFLTQTVERDNDLAQEVITATNNAGTGMNAAGAPHPPRPPAGINVFKRFTQFLERIPQPTKQSDPSTEQFNQLFERFNQLVEQSSQHARRANELSETSNELAYRAKQLAEWFNQSSEPSNQLAERSNKSVERKGDLLKNINEVLVGI
ncbi:hypothetical protein B0J17DRAFT_719514 [Rhizoctonia solani]|nr:hypothetical protein B0J17DRAFT_719514 [Rhizoctonia solani]